MRKIISNTTPILSLLKINKLDLLKELYGIVIIPNAVFQEVENGREKQYYQDLSILSWIEIANINNPESRVYFTDLDDGEAEVLILAKEQNADLGKTSDVFETSDVLCKFSLPRQMNSA